MPIVRRKVILIRHAECDANSKDLICGVTDSPLSKCGAASLRQISPVDIDSSWSVLSSTLVRASETAKMIFPQAKIVYSDSLAEIDFGDLEMRSKYDFQFALSKFGEYWDAHSAPSLTSYLNSVSSFLGKPSGNLVVVTHGGFINIVLHSVLDIGLNEFPRFIIDNLHAVVLTSSDVEDKWMLNAMNIGPRSWKCELV